MKLRAILIVIALIAVLSIAFGGIYFVTSLRKSIITIHERKADFNTQFIRDNIERFIEMNDRSVLALASIEEVKTVLESPDSKTIADVNIILDKFRDIYEAEACYLMDAKGKTIASTNRNQSDSFVGKSYSFRPYFKRSLKGDSAVYMAVGKTTGKKGVFNSCPVYGNDNKAIVGVAVIKTSVKYIEDQLASEQDVLISLVGPEGLIFVSNCSYWVLKLIWKIPDSEQVELAKTEQFGAGPWKWIGVKKIKGNEVVDDYKNRYRIYKYELKNCPAWSVVSFLHKESVFTALNVRFVNNAEYIVVFLCFCIGL
ncbi:MAG: hypothetical protein P9M03_05445, partial [Candidatus Theseobacter exili]|nr:hypothetical protein [Candidatus Theseobacter exili]